MYKNKAAKKAFFVTAVVCRVCDINYGDQTVCSVVIYYGTIKKVITQTNKAASLLKSLRHSALETALKLR